MFMASTNPAYSCWDVDMRLLRIFMDATQLWEIGITVKEGFSGCFGFEGDTHASRYAFGVSSAPWVKVSDEVDEFNVCYFSGNGRS